MLEILYEKYILISFSAREDGEEGNGNKQRSYFCKCSRGGHSFNIIIIIGAAWKVLCRVFYRYTQTDPWSHSLISSKHIELIFCTHKPTHTPISLSIFLAFPRCFPSATPSLPIREAELKQYTACLTNYSARGEAAAWVFPSVVGCDGGKSFVFNARGCGAGMRCLGLTAFVKRSLIHLPMQLLLFPASGPSPGPPPSPHPPPARR